MYLQLMDDILPLEVQEKNNLFIETITPFHINTTCSICIYNLAIIYKHMLLSKDTEIMFFITQLCGIIYENFKAITRYNGFLKENLPENIYNEYNSRKKKIGIYTKGLELIRNKSAFHIDKDFLIYYDKMLDSFKMPILDIYNDMMGFVNYLQNKNKHTMIKQIEKYKFSISNSALIYIEKLKNDIIKFPENEEKQLLLSILKQTFN